MNKVNVKKDKLITYFFAALVLTLVSFFVYSLLTGLISFGSIEGGWDGYTVATSFDGGNGAEDNPYVIKTPEQFIYFKSLIEGENYKAYQDKYYVLGDDINLNNKSLSGIGIMNDDQERYFSGHFDGAGYKIVNIKIDKPTIINEVSYYSLFNKTIDADVKNIIIDSYSIKTDKSSEKVSVGLFGDVAVSDKESIDDLSNISDITISNLDIDYSLTDGSDNNIGIIANNVFEKVVIKNIYLEGKITGNNNSNNIGIVSNELLGKVSYIVSNLTTTNISDFNILNDKIDNQYTISDGKIYLKDQEVSMDDVIKGLDDSIDSKYYWDLEEGKFVIKEYAIRDEKLPDSSKGFSFTINSVSEEILLHDSGVSGNTVYINDLDSDLNYYKGLNYTESTNGTWPSGNDSNKYNDNTLAKVYIAYSGKEIDSDDVIGYVSLSEQYSNIIYYKYYPIENGYVTIPLIDNPFADRPNNRAFNGWVTDYDGALVTLDVDTYTRYVRVPASSEINITMYASWAEATVANSITSNTLKSVDMVRVATNRTPIYDTPVLYSQGSVRATNNQGTAYPNGAYDENGNSLNGQRCYRINNQTTTCYYYTLVNLDNISQGQSYYQLLNGTMTTYVVPAPVDYNITSFLNKGDSLAGYFKRVSVSNASRAGLYSNTGVMQTGNGTGTYYQLIQDPDEVLTPDNYDQYYYLVTRDTNIAYLTGTVNGTTTSRPMTITGLNNNTLNNTCVINLNGTGFFNSYSLIAGADLRIEYCQLRSNSTQSTSGPANSTNNQIRGMYYNLKIGRGIRRYTNGNTNYYSSNSLIGGSNASTGSSASPTKYSLIVESGYYNSISTVSTTSNSNNVYVQADAIYGSDIDRVLNDNSQLEVYYNVAGTNGGTVRSGSNSTTVAFVHQTVKSGTLGEANNTPASGIYCGGLSGGTIYSPSVLIIEGGDIYNVNGGPLISSTVKASNMVYIHMKGGTADSIFGGAALTETYGNRIVSVTGGMVNGAVFGGSNGVEGSNGSGTLDGNTFIYVGGKSEIGNTSLATGWFGAEIGSVFGAGNGNNTYSTIGAVNNSKIIIDGNATINGNVYGGGNYGAVSAQSGNVSTSTITVKNSTIKGSIYGGGNNNGSGSTTVTSTINIQVDGGTIENSVYGGSRTKGTVYGSVNVTVNGGNIKTDVYGGGEGGYTNNNSPGTYVRDNVAVIINNGQIDGSVYGGSAFGTVNAINQTSATSNSTTKVTVNGGVVQNNVFGGAKGSSAFTPRVVGDITVNVNGGSIGNVFGGMDASGKPSNGDVVYLNGGTIGNAFGGGNNANQDETNIYLQGSTITGNLYGGSNLLGTVTESNVYVTNGSVTDIYGGNNLDGLTVNTNVTVTGADINGDIYGGGNEADSGISNVSITGVHVNDVYGGGKKAGLTTSNVELNNVVGNKVFGGSNISGNVTTSNVDITGSTLVASYGGNNQGGSTTTTNLDVTTSTITNVFGGGDNASSGVSHVKIHSGTITNVYGGGNEAGLTTSNVNVDGGNITNVFGGSNASGDLSDSNVFIGQNGVASNISISNVYGGNNQGGITNSCNVTAYSGTVGTIYGGGNEASVGTTYVVANGVTSTNIYGGGNAAGVTGNTVLDIDNTTVTNNIYGGGNEGIVQGNTNVTVTDSSIKGNAFAGGNGSTAVVHGNSTITIDGTAEIGTSSSHAPDSGCVFGSGNAASTGLESTNNSKATVNIVGGIIHGNVYGGPKMAVVYGTTETNIGASAVSINYLNENNIVISGTVFGGGESNASGSETYDWTFISVTKGIDVNIDGTGYIAHNHDFIINGSIFGSGNASSSAGDSNVDIKNLGSRSQPNKSISIQRATNLVIDSSVIELEGTTDRTNEYSDILYSFNMIDKLILKNNSVLLLKHNANMLKELYSGVDTSGTLVPASVSIDEDSKTVTRNVDNRIYMIPGQNLNITINQSATAYGKVTGMTFFGMYNSYDNGTYRYGLYDDDLEYGDSGNASLEIVGGSYVIGLHHTNHDIEVDGFYSNYLNDDFTEVKVDYINPTEIGETGYRWTVGFEAINYEFTLTASKYSSLGTHELQLIDFANGNITFDVLGLDASGLNPDISLVDSTAVPRLGRTEEEANSIFGLSMKAETQEWTGYGTTKMLDADGGSITGDRVYKTDNRKVPPSLMFYLYHAKNISSQADLGTVVMTVQAAIPKNAIESDIKYITITINMVSRDYGDGDSYDASITYDKKYEMPASTLVNITNQSQFSTYFSLIAWSDNFESVYGNNNSNYHVLVTNRPLPVNTMITMLDYGANDNRPEYYYFKVTQSVYDDSVAQLAQYNEVVYKLSDFIKMDSTSTTNTYSDQESNLLYYNEDVGLVDEEFIFIFDLKDSTETGEHLNNSVLFELRNNEDRTVYNVLGIREELMHFNTYESSNVVLQQTITDTNDYLYYNVADEFNYVTRIRYNQTSNNLSVIDTNYESSSMGLNVELFDKDGLPVSSSLLIGTSIKIDNREYFADGGGVFRIKLANKVSNLDKIPKLTVNKDLPAGEYKIKYTLFASDDGLHNSDYRNSVSEEFTVHVVSADNSITVDCEDLVKVVDGEAALNLAGTRFNTYKVKYESQLTNPNFRVEIFKRDTSTIDSTLFTSVPFDTLFSNNFTNASGNEVYIDMGTDNEKSFTFNLQNELTSGTYRIVFKLYDNNQLIDDDIKYVIVKKKVE